MFGPLTSHNRAPKGSRGRHGTNNPLGEALSGRATTLGTRRVCHHSGGTEFDLRTRHVESFSEAFDGFAIGGLSVGESIPDMYATLAHTAPQMPKDKPRYLMGVGRPADLVEGVARGVDMFDCVMPTRNARKGGLFVDQGRKKMNIRNADSSRIPSPSMKIVTATHARTIRVAICGTYSMRMRFSRIAYYRFTTYVST